METWIEIAGLTISSPVTAFTNLLLSVQCMTYYRRLRGGRGDRSGNWSLFFLAMAVATLAGAPKHGLKHALPGDIYTVILWLSSLGSAASVYFAQRATLVSCVSADSRSPLRSLCILEAWLFLGASVALGPEMWLVVVNTAVGLIPVILAESLAIRDGSRRGAWIVAGLGVSMFTGVVYVGHLSMGRWLNHIDIAHVLMGVSFFLIVRGSRVSDGDLGLHALLRRREPDEATGRLVPLRAERA